MNANARLDEETGEYVFLGNAFERSTQNEYGLFAQDSWRARPNLTLNFGVRWEVQGPFTTQNNSYTTATVEDLWGVSGPGNLFKPGIMTGRPTQFVQYTEGTGAYKTDYKNFAPSFGFAWSPGASSGWLKRVLGEGGQTVVRGGYSMAYNRQGIGDFRGTFGANPGVTITTNRDLVSGTLVANTKTDLPLLLRDPGALTRPVFPNKPTYPLTGAPFVAVTNSVNIFDPNIEVPYSQSWILGIQREITKDMTIEVRYVGTRNLRGWTDYDLNDVEQNILENGMFEEFKLAQANLQANIAGGFGNHFRYRGPGTGTFPLPITVAHFGVGLDPNSVSSYSSALFANATTFVNQLARFNPNPITFAANLHNDAGRRANALANDPKYQNFFLTNPGLRGGVFFTGNGGYNRYDGLQIELRRRLSRGLLVEANYQFAKSFSSERVSFRAPRINALNDEILRHALKFNWAYELPFGNGRAFFGNAGHLVNRLVSGWEFYGSARIQSGSLFDFGNVSLVGMTMKELQDVYKLRFESNGVFLLPDDVIVNTKKAFGTSATS
ncbi:MAG: TonB-dependent receptor, partial [Acidobacteria bacterium]|nr:TonB-dependent receptor [Acidobacteriota bacterium]